MFGWGRRKQSAPATQADAERMFMQAMAQVSTLSAVDRATVAYGVAFSWKVFNAQFKSVENFRRQSFREQNIFVDGLQNMQVKLAANGDPGVGIGVSLTIMFLAAVIECDAAMINRLSDQLEPLNREGFLLVG